MSPRTPWSGVAGCGTGLLAIAAAGRGFAVTAADADADMTALAAARLGGAHLTQATADEVDIPWRIDPEDLWLGVTAGIAGIGAVWSAQSHATRLRMRAAYDEVATAYLDDGLLSLPSRAVLCSALAPA